MGNVLTLSMVCFPYVMMGVGQAIIASTNLPERKIDKTDDIRGRRITQRAFKKASFNLEGRTLSGHPAWSPY
jgi:hypothetical protein